MSFQVQQLLAYIWNTLPTDIKRAATLLTFLNNSRPFFSEKNIYVDVAA